MIIYVADDEIAPLHLLGDAIREAEPHATVELFQKPLDLLKRAEERPADVVFLDIQMADFDGLHLARKIQELGVAKNVVFVTSYADYALEAYDMFASGYLLKPASVDDIRDQLKHLRVPVVTSQNRIKVKTFGGFLVLVDGEPVKFKRAKSQEILAFIVDKHGESVTFEELAEALWENTEFGEEKMGYLRVLISRMRKDLEDAGGGDMLTWMGTLPVANLGHFWCDAYELMDGDPVARNQFNGEYLINYWWSETTNAKLFHLAANYDEG